MALSDEEQRMLDQLEATLAAEDPKLAHALGATKPAKPSGGRVALAAIGFAAGVLLLILGIQVGWPISVVGFVLMFGSVGAVLIARPRGPVPTAQKSHEHEQTSFMNRMEDRWNRRQGGAN
jgi:hypothetical protein